MTETLTNHSLEIEPSGSGGINDPVFVRLSDDFVTLAYCDEAPRIKQGGNIFHADLQRLKARLLPGDASSIAAIIGSVTLSRVILIPEKIGVMVAQAILPVRPLVDAHRQDCRCHHFLKRYSFLETV